ncbi:hypothetical protein CWE13_03085 [Aliidiomarina shirensis]|uniref:YcxB-like protein domain-containing protein n=1 Tax=Aliidiomarina shirensis TaxID=1048642 RepID=A0A432WY03_9GAMM|nr:hypothetical protein [Aliidiomarina shirensis]RUO38645.1 hypothetical protein CWE13_03085 [Aliidiomarina shirensis]
MVVYNPIWIQFILYVAIVSFPCLSGYMFYLAYEALPKSGLSGAGIFIFLGAGVAYISYIGLLLAKFVPAKVVFDDSQFTVEIKGTKNSYAWSDIAEVKNYEISQILKLVDSSGVTIYVVDHMTPGYKSFAEKVSESVGI